MIKMSAKQFANIITSENQISTIKSTKRMSIGTRSQITHYTVALSKIKKFIRQNLEVDYLIEEAKLLRKEATKYNPFSTKGSLSFSMGKRSS